MNQDQTRNLQASVDHCTTKPLSPMAYNSCLNICNNLSRDNIPKTGTTSLFFLDDIHKGDGTTLAIACIFSLLPILTNGQYYNTNPTLLMMVTTARNFTCLQPASTVPYLNSNCDYSPVHIRDITFNNAATILPC